MIVIDEQRIFKEIKEKNPASVSLNGPDGILPQVQETAIKISEKFEIPAYILADTTWGTVIEFKWLKSPWSRDSI